MATLHLIIMICVFIVVTLFVFFLFFPGTPAKARRKKRKEGPVQPEGKDWEAVAHKLERYIYSLRREIDKLKNGQKKNLYNLEVEKVRNKKLKERIQQEKEWLKKEKSSFERQSTEVYQSKRSLKKAEEDREKEYAQKLKIERDFKELKHDHQSKEKENLGLSSKLMHTESQLNSFNQEFRELKRVNAQLKKENDEASWVAKSEYEKLENLLKGKEKEIERLSQKPGTSGHS